MKYQQSSEGKTIINKDYSKKVIFFPADFTEKGHQLQIVIIPANTKQRLHAHKIQTEIFYILEGESIITINQIDYVAHQGDAFICSPGDTHNLWNKSDKDFKLVVFKINYSYAEDTVWKE